MTKETKETIEPKIPKNTKFSIRLSSQSVTSISINTHIILLWLIFQPKTSSKLKNVPFPSDVKVLQTNLLRYCKSICTDFFISQMKNWPYNSGKGLSDFLTEAMIQDILQESSDLRRTYTKVKEVFKES